MMLCRAIGEDPDPMATGATSQTLAVPYHTIPYHTAAHAHVMKSSTTIYLYKTCSTRFHTVHGHVSISLRAATSDTFGLPGFQL